MRWEEQADIIFSNISKNVVDIKETKIGKITSLNPLQVEIGKLVLNKENLYISEDLLRHSRVCSISSKNDFNNIEIIFESRLYIGDLVALRKLEFEKYYIENKIVKGRDI